MVAVVPVLFAQPKTDWSQYSDQPYLRSEFPIGRQFIAENGERSFWFFTWARWACIPFSLLGGYVCFRWARELYGPWSGLLALTLWCFSPYMLAIRDFIQRGELGEIVEVEVRLNMETPWDLFPFLLQESRVEILAHTVHHLDLVRYFLGDPQRVYAHTVKHPRFPKLASTRSSVILDYGDMIRCCLSINHCHRYGLRHMDASVRIEGTEGCAVATLGLLLNYPRGQPDKLEVIGQSAKDWTAVPLSGRWFPDGFVGVMSNVQRFAAGEDPALVSPVEDGLETMRLVEACYVSDQRGGTELNSLK